MFKKNNNLSLVIAILFIVGCQSSNARQWAGLPLVNQAAEARRAAEEQVEREREAVEQVERERAVIQRRLVEKQEELNLVMEKLAELTAEAVEDGSVARVEAIVEDSGEVIGKVTAESEEVMEEMQVVFARLVAAQARLEEALARLAAMDE